MYPRQINKSDVDRLYTWLATAGGAASELLQHWYAMLEDAELKLDKLARGALFDDSRKHDALVQYGRVTQLKELIAFVKSKQRSDV